MKAQLFPLALFFFFVSCITPKFYHQRVNNIPTKSPNFEVLVYLLGDQIPEKPYFEIVDFYMAEKGRLSKSAILKKLEFEAIKEGVDAVIDVEYWNRKEPTVNALTVFIDLIDEDGETTYINTHFTHIRGIGIKYLENIDYVHELPEFEYMYLIDAETGFPTPCFKIEYALTGQEHKVYPEAESAMDIYRKYFQFYSDYHLLHQREGWTYVKRDNKVTRRMMINEEGLTLKRCIPEYDKDGKMIALTIFHAGTGTKETERVIYHFDEKGRKFGRTVLTHEKVKVYEQYVFDGEMLTGRKIKINIPGGAGYFLNSSILYYDTDYLRMYYEEEYAAMQLEISKE